MAGCSEIRLVGAYDEKTDESIQKTAKDVTMLFVKVEKNIDDGNTAANSYANFRDTYIEIESDLAALRMRCSALPKYQQIVQQIDLLENNITTLESLHKTGLTSKALLAPAKSAMDVAFKAMFATQNALKREKVDKGKN
jgi:uncharacterized protein YydD (DUF2326 family)